MTKSMWVRSLVLTTAVTALAGCGSISSTLGLERHVPDETQVTVRPNLTLPPDYDLMPPGTPSAVSAEHEGGAAMGAPLAPKKEERGFFGSLFHGDFFGNEPDAATAKEHAADAAAAPAPDVNGTPQTPPPAVTAPPPADAAPPAEPKKDEPGFFGRVFGGIF